MDKDLAKRLMDQLVKCHEAMSEAEVIAREISDPSHREAARKAILEAAGVLSTEVMFDITAEYPELHPYPPSKGGRERPA